MLLLVNSLVGTLCVSSLVLRLGSYCPRIKFDIWVQAWFVELLLVNSLVGVLNYMVAICI